MGKVIRSDMRVLDENSSDGAKGNDSEGAANSAGSAGEGNWAGGFGETTILCSSDVMDEKTG